MSSWQGDIDDEDVQDEPSFADGGVVRQHVARRPGRCERCPIGRGVQPGEAYRVWTSLDEDRAFFSERYCADMPAQCRAVLPPIEASRFAPAAAGPVDPENLPF